MKKDEIQIYTDGGSRGNPGKAACAFVVYQNEKEIFKDSKYLGITTNNVAEYSGVLLALEWVISSTILNSHIEDGYVLSTLNFFLDSELVVKQLNGVYKIKDEKMKSLSLKIFQIITKNKLKISFKNIPRENNKVSDGLVNTALDRV